MARALEEWQLDDYLRALALNKWLILLITAVAVGAAVTFLSQEPDRYTATAQILIETEPPQYLKFQQEGSSHGQSWDKRFLETEYYLMANPVVLDRVAETLRLSDFAPFSDAADPTEQLAAMVSVQPLRGTKLVDVKVTGEKPKLLSRIADAVADTYVRFNLERRRSLTTGGLYWIREELRKMEGRIQASQEQLHTLLAKHPSIDMSAEQQRSVLRRLQSLNAALTNTRKERIEAQARFREKHPKILELAAKEQELGLALFDQEQSALEANRISIQYSALEREVKTSEQIYNILLTRMKQLAVQEGLETNNVQVVSHARIPTQPFAPNRQAVLWGALLLGLAVGSSLSILRAILAKVLLTRQEFEEIVGIPYLGQIPSVPRRIFGTQGQLPLLDSPQSSPAEAIRGIRTSLAFIVSGKGSHALVVTSALPEEGKSFTCANLAIGLKELGEGVLVIDADMRRPSLHKRFNLPLAPGLSTYLQHRVNVEDLVQSAQGAKGLSVISAGTTVLHPSDLLASERMGELLRMVRERYRFCLIDTPPVLAVPDAAALSKFVDGALYVVRGNRTHQEAAQAGKARLSDVGIRVVGGILNAVPIKIARHYPDAYYPRSYTVSGDWEKGPVTKSDFSSEINRENSQPG